MITLLAGPARAAVWVFLAGLLIMTGLVAIDYVPTRGTPAERAIVTGVRGTGGRTDCGRTVLPNTDEVEVTWTVLEPLPDLPATFTWTGCPGDRVGDTTDVVRLGPGGRDERLGTFSGWADVVLFAAAIAAAVSVPSYIGLLIRNVCRGLSRRGRHAR